MKDRVPTKPGRTKITPEDGNPAFYATVEMADVPSEVGTPLNKATLLTDETAALFGLGADAVPDDVLALLSLTGSQFVIGSETVEVSRDFSKSFNVDLGFKPIFVIYYAANRNNSNTLSLTANPYYSAVPIIISQEYTNVDNYITENGFRYFINVGNPTTATHTFNIVYIACRKVY